MTWAAIARDADFVISGGSGPRLASQPLWLKGAPDQHVEYWERLRKALPNEGNWQVWIDWYNRRLEGVSDPEEIELVFATIPDKEREAGPAAANKWIKERLEELQKKESPAIAGRNSAPAATNRKPSFALHVRSQRRRTDHHRRGAAKYAGHRLPRR